MGPNSGGGKRNKDNNNPASGCARNRFSKWRPPTANLKDKFSKQQESRVQGQDIRNTNTGSQAAPKSKGSIEVHKGPTKGDRPTSLSIGGELLTFSNTVLLELLRIFGIESMPAAQTPKIANVEIVKAPTAINVAPIKTESATSAAVPSRPAAVPPLNRPEDSLERRRCRTFLRDLGFEVDEVSLCLNGCGELAERKDELSELELLLHILMQVTNPTKKSPSDQCVDIAPEDLDISSNEDLMSEIEVLSSIYGENVTYRAVSLCGKPCCIVDIRVPIEEEIVGNSQVFGKAVSASSSPQPTLLMNVRLFITDMKAYPAADALVYGWVLPNEPSNTDLRHKAKGNNKNGKQEPVSVWLPTSAARQLSLGAMRHIHAYQTQSEAPAAFEFIQHIRENMAPVLSALPASAFVINPEVFPMKTASLGTAGAGRPKAPEPEPVKELAATEVLGPPPMPPRPSTQFMQSIEYRTALSAAFSASLVGEAARARAHAELEFILPKVNHRYDCA